MANLKKSSEVSQRLVKIAGIIAAKKAKDIVALDVKNLSSLCDYFIICSGDSTPQIKAIHQDLIKSCKKDKIKAQHSEGDYASGWILVDFFDIVLHIFSPEARDFYNLENLWSKAKKISLNYPRL